MLTKNPHSFTVIFFIKNHPWSEKESILQHEQREDGNEIFKFSVIYLFRLLMTRLKDKNKSCVLYQQRIDTFLVKSRI